MYSTRTIHKNINPNYNQSYTSIGDPYKHSGVEELPERWKSKQFVTQRCPQNAQNGFFSKLQYHPEKYVEISEQFSETYPLEKRKLGFGSRDAFKRGEFTSTKATERYRDTVRQEAKLLGKHRDEKKERELIDKLNDRSNKTAPPKDKLGRSLQVPEFLYDIGRTQITPYNPHQRVDRFYNLPIHGPVDRKWKGEDSIRRLGAHRPMSAVVGEHAWKHKYVKPEFGRKT